MNTDDPVRVERRDGIGFVILNRPASLNVLDTPALEILRGALIDLEKEGATRAVIMTGIKHFSAGADVRELKEKGPEQADAFSRLGQDVCSRIENMRKPVIAAVRGYALGAGCEIALSCDIRIAAKSARFGQPEINLGLVPGFGGTVRLARLLGIGSAKELALTGRIVDAKEAERTGLASMVVSEEELTEKATEMAGALAEKSPVALRLIKRLINGFNEPRGRLQAERAAFVECFRAADHREGLSAFLEKRKPHFNGE